MPVAQVAWLVPGMLLLIWAAAYRVQANWLRPSTLNDEPLAYPLQVRRDGREGRSVKVGAYTLQVGGRRGRGKAMLERR